jgi:hypothetical protein
MIFIANRLKYKEFYFYSLLGTNTPQLAAKNIKMTD